MRSRRSTPLGGFWLSQSTAREKWPACQRGEPAVAAVMAGAVRRRRATAPFAGSGPSTPGTGQAPRPSPSQPDGFNDDLHNDRSRRRADDRSTARLRIQIEPYARDLVGAILTASDRTVLSGHLVARGGRR